MNPARILVVEDEMIIARELATQLRMLGYEPVGHATRGEQAVALARELLPELVLMDIHLAGDMDGIAAAQQIRGQLDVPVIFVTAFATDEILSRAKITEPYGYILKPYSEREIHTVIEIALYKHKVDRKLHQSMVSSRESAQHTQAILDNMVDAVITINERGLMESFNLAASAIFGYSADEVMGHNVSMLIPEPHRGQHDGYLAHYRDTGEEHIIGKPRELAGMRKDGSVFPMGLSVSRITRGDQPVFVGLIHDISVRRAADEKLRTNAIALDSISQGVLITDHNRRIVSANAAFSTITGYTEQEILGRNCDFLHGPLTAPQTKLHISQAVTEGSEFDGQIVNYRKDGTAFWNDLTMSPVRNAEGVVVQYIGITRDISERKRAEEARLSLEEQLRESQKMEAIGTLAGGVAHDFSNILANILVNTELAHEDAAGNAPVQESLTEINKAAIRARDLVQQILSFSRRQPTERKVIALGTVVVEAERLLRATLPPRLALRVRCAADVPAVLADATQMQQVIINLASNAMQAMREGTGHIDIGLDTVNLDAALAAAHPQLEARHPAHPGRMLRLSVRDDGPGMDAATLARIFEPFFTTKPIGEGTGLGLPVVHGIVQTHEGGIEVDSQPGKGTTFTIYLPVAAAAANAAVPDERAAATSLPSGATGSHHILYIDDDASLVFAVLRLLERRGYRISGYTNQGAALDALRADPAGFDLVVTDYNMPGMSGLDVAREVKAIRADLPVAVASGFIDETLRAQADEAGVEELIFKASAARDLCEAFARLAQTVGEKAGAARDDNLPAGGGR